MFEPDTSAYTGIRDTFSGSRRCSYTAAASETDTISSDEARFAMATLTIIRVARSRAALQLADVLHRWRLNSHAVLIDSIVRKQLVPLLTCRSSMINSYRPRPEEYVPYGGEEDVFLSLLRGELHNAEVSLTDNKSQAGCDGTESCSDEASLRLDLDSASAMLYAPLGRGHLELSSPGISPAARRGSDGRSPTPTDLSESATSFMPTPARSRGHTGLTLKQLSEGDRALSAAVERELRRAAELAKVKQRYERSEQRCSRAQQALQNALSEVEQLRAEVNKLKLSPSGAS